MEHRGPERRGVPVERSEKRSGAAGEASGPPVPEAFEAARRALSAARLRPEIELEPLPAPRGIAPFSVALAAAVVAPGDADDEDDLASGRFVLLHDPRGQDAWEGEFRAVTLVRAELEPDIADDPLLPEVGWAWLMEALGERGAAFRAEGGTVSRCASRGFGNLAERPRETTVEIRASWTPCDEDFAAHLEAWGALLSMCAGLPPDVAGVVPLVPGDAGRMARYGGQARPRREPRR